MYLYEYTVIVRRPAIELSEIKETRTGDVFVRPIKTNRQKTNQCLLYTYYTYDVRTENKQQTAAATPDNTETPVPTGVEQALQR